MQNSWNDMEADPCYYCGLPAETVDHVVPRSLLDAVRGSGDDKLVAYFEGQGRKMTVRACRECNNLASAKYHETLEERATYVRSRLARKYRKVLAMPDWHPREMVGMSDTLRRIIVGGLVERDIVRRRLRWRAKGNTPAADEWWAGGVDGGYE